MDAILGETGAAAAASSRTARDAEKARAGVGARITVREEEARRARRTVRGACGLA
jgi:hypothetical protein